MNSKHCQVVVHGWKGLGYHGVGIPITELGLGSQFTPNDMYPSCVKWAKKAYSRYHCYWFKTGMFWMAHELFLHSACLLGQTEDSVS